MFALYFFGLAMRLESGSWRAEPELVVQCMSTEAKCKTCYCHVDSKTVKVILEDLTLHTWAILWAFCYFAFHVREGKDIKLLDSETSEHEKRYRQAAFRNITSTVDASISFVAVCTSRSGPSETQMLWDLQRKCGCKAMLRGGGVLQAQLEVVFRSWVVLWCCLYQTIPTILECMTTQLAFNSLQNVLVRSLRFSEIQVDGVDDGSDWHRRIGCSVFIEASKQEKSILSRTI